MVAGDFDTAADMRAGTLLFFLLDRAPYTGDFVWPDIGKNIGRRTVKFNLEEQGKTLIRRTIVVVMRLSCMRQMAYADKR